MACAIEDAGFEIRDQIQWLYGSGFPKSHDISKAIDKKLGAEREVIGKSRGVGKKGGETYSKYGGFKAGEIEITASATELARKWNGWGTALKPAHEPIVLARKPLSEKTIADNVLKWGTGGLNIDGCRIEYQSEKDFESAKGGNSGSTKCNIFSANGKKQSEKITPLGRFPANVILDEEAGRMLDEQTGTLRSGFMKAGHPYGQGDGQNVYGKLTGKTKSDTYGDSGGASRFFYCAKASKKERNMGLEDVEPTTVDDGRNKPIDNPFLRGKTPRRNTHPTVKPVKLMEYLITLVTPPNGIVLDPFMGSGTTAVACIKTNRKYIGFELLEEYCKIAEKRISEATSNQIEPLEIERNVPQRQFDWLDELLEG
jgi:site-specific DNA-methyltransferase (adenine-specific)